MAQDLVHHLSLPTTLHPNAYQLGWVQKEGPCLTVSHHCVVTFAIGTFRDTMVCDVSPPDCVDLLLGIPYSQARDAVYHAKDHKYHLQHEGLTYVLASSALTSIQPLTGKYAIKKVNINKYIPLCLVHSVKPKNNTNPIPAAMAPLQPKFANIFTKYTVLHPKFSIEHQINLIPSASLSTTPSFFFAGKPSIGHD